MGMESRRSFFSVLAVFAAASSQLKGAPSQQATRTAGVIPLPSPYDKQSATLVEIYCAPGQQTKAHRHPGFVLGYVMEGELRFQIAGQPERVLRTGETFYEPPGATHLLAVTASPDRPARFLAIVIADSGKAIVEPA
jgi:quercetin dioxygenase-like cupin family protein